MDTTKTDPAITNDVLDLGHGSTLSAEAIAKAVAHHNRHHGDKPAQDATAKPAAGKKQMNAKSK